MSEPELAPEGCVVCGKRQEAGGREGWTYFSGSVPLGARTCSAVCTKVAFERYKKTGRVDDKAAES